MSGGCDGDDRHKERMAKIRQIGQNLQTADRDLTRESLAAPGYHVSNIQKGVLGELSKIQEELDEVRDAAAQGVKVMELVELSDLIGAVVRYLEAKHPGTNLQDLIDMHKVTRRAFENGHRRSP